MKEKFFLDWQKRLNQNSTLLMTAKFFGITIVHWYILGLGLMLFLPNGKNLFITGGLAFVLGWGVLVKGGEYIIKKQRPYQRFDFIPKAHGFLSGLHRDPDAFPSGHATALSALTTAFFFLNPLIGFLSLVVALVVGMFRVILGFHDFVDVIVGWGLGVIAGVCAFYLLNVWF